MGLVLLGVGTLLFLALVSYTPGDLPTWIPFSQISPPNEPVHNFIGPFGAVVAGFFYFIWGAASYLVPAIMFGYGGVKLLSVPIRVVPRLGWILLFLVSGACILAVQPYFLDSWKETFNIHGAGGWVGYFFGEKLLATALNIPGSLIILTVIYLTSLILMTGLKPVETIRAVRVGIQNYLQRRREMAEQRASDEERLQKEQARIEREQKKLEKQLRKSPPPSTEADPDLPAPRIIDSISNSANASTSAKRDKSSDLSLQPDVEPNYDDYKMPDFDLLESFDPASRQAADPAELMEIQSTIIDTLAQFNIPVSPGDITRGPTITRYEVYPAKGVRVDKIVNLERDLARQTRAERINIIAPIPGKDTVGIEIANSQKMAVTLREIMDSHDWQNSDARIPITLGKDVYGNIIIGDLAKMPHCLVAGTTGSGKSVCINAMIASMLYKFTPKQLRLIMIDPKVVELQVYNRLPHLHFPVVNDPKQVLNALRVVIDEMENRYKIFAKLGVRNIVTFNAHQKKAREEAAALEAEKAADAEKEAALFDRDAISAEETPDEVLEDLDEMEEDDAPLPDVRVPRDHDLKIPDHMPYMVVIIDELADLMLTAPADVESAIARITQMARAAGIHMIVATQTPRADVITGVIKANIPSRIAFQVASKIDSRVILDENGADRLLGQGDMLYLPPGTARLTRAQGVLVTDNEITRIVDYVSTQAEPDFKPALQERIERTSPDENELTDEEEELVEKCIEIIRQEKRASTSLLQRRLRLGYTRAARIVDILEQRGIVGPGEGAKPREILIDLENPEAYS